MKSKRLLRVPFEIAIDAGPVIRGDVRYSTGGSVSPRQPVLVVAHGFKTFKDWGPFPHIGEQFAKAGFVSIVFNFSHNGVGSNPHRITEFERFAKNTVSRELEDLRLVLKALLEGSIPAGPADKNVIGVVGHSRGAGVAVVCARNDSSIKALAGWSAVSTFDRWTRRQKQEWYRRGYLGLTGGGTKSKFRMDVEFLEDLQKTREKLDVLSAVSELHIPLLLVYGTQDLVTPVEEAEKLLYASDRTRSELILLRKTGHMFGAGTNPFRGSPTLDHVIDLTSSWFHRNL